MQCHPKACHLKACSLQACSLNACHPKACDSDACDPIPSSIGSQEDPAADVIRRAEAIMGCPLPDAEASVVQLANRPHCPRLHPDPMPTTPPRSHADGSVRDATPAIAHPRSHTRCSTPAVPLLPQVRDVAPQKLMMCLSFVVPDVIAWREGGASSAGGAAGGAAGSCEGSGDMQAAVVGAEQSAECGGDVGTECSPEGDGVETKRQKTDES